MKKQGDTSLGKKSNKNKSSRSNPEGISRMKKDNMKLKHSPSKTFQKSVVKKTKAFQKQGSMELSTITEQRSSLRKKAELTQKVGSANSSLDETPETLSQISSIMPSEEYTVLSPSYKQTLSKSQMDATWELAVDKARGQPDGAEGSFSKKTPKPAIKQTLAPDKKKTLVKEKENTKAKKKNVAAKYIKVNNFYMS